MLIFKTCERVVDMMKTPVAQRLKIGVAVMLMTLGIAHNAYSAPAQKPLFQTNSVKPIMMLNMSKEHQLYFKLYDDYSDIAKDDGTPSDGTGTADTTYNNNYNYYGYFDSNKCYAYSSTDKRFNPVELRTEKYCNTGTTTNQWSGNFLNWASMTRMDAIRKILYGGYRSTDTAAVTVLERAFLPNDAHSFAKFYDGTDLKKLTPLASDSTNTDLKKRGITICNTSEPSDRSKASQQTIGADLPLIRVAKGNYSLWASNERWQCRWGTGTNGNNVAHSDINANSSAPSGPSSDLATNPFGDYVARVQVCASGLMDIIDGKDNEKCKAYGVAASFSYKPTGLLHTYGETDRILFGLLTGSYGKNKSGGVLRKKVGSITDEIDSSNGTFKIPDSGNSIIGTLNLLRIYGYRFDDGTYHSSTASDDCIWAKSSFDNGKCSNWGNPQAEIYLESLRYLAGKEAATTAFNADDSSKIPNLKSVTTWDDPIVTQDESDAGNFCAPLNVLQFNASTTSYDTDDLSGASLWTEMATYDTEAKNIGDYEHITGTNVFVGENGIAADKDQLCGAKKVVNFANLQGICPESPRLEGGYKLAGLAYLARKTGIATGREKVKTFGVALAPAVPRVTITVPSSTSTVTILPACRNLTPNPDANCAIVDFKVVKQYVEDGKVKGKLYVNWEDSEQGGDFDQDMWGIISYEVSSRDVKVTTQVIAESSGDAMGFGYVISGTKKDGFHAHSGMHGFNWVPSTTVGGLGCTNCQHTDAATSRTFDIGESAATSLPPPLYYAAKWGGYSNNEDGSTPTTAEIAAGPAETYFYATDPSKLEASLREAFDAIAGGIGAASSVATVSARVSEGSLVYQAQFNSENWTGNLLAYEFDKAGTIKTTPTYCTSDTIIAGKKECVGQMATSSSSRTIYTSNGTALKSLEWSNLTQSQKDGLRLLSEATVVPDPTEITYANAKKRLDWFSGNATYEEATTGGTLRNRGVDTNRNILGDIVNSSPVYVADRNFRYESLPGDAGTKYKTFLATKKDMPKYIIVGSNGGMVHAFDATTLKEKFAFIPSNNFLREKTTDNGTKLTNLTSPTYGNVPANSHTYNVDGPIAYSDVYITVTVNETTSVKMWRRVVVGTFGAGGRSIYALDVTEATPKLLFELNEADYPELGYVIGKPIIAPMKNGRWAAIFGNGSDSGKASHLFVVDIEEPKNSTLTKVISAGEGTGLSAPALLLDGVGQALTVYAGDIDGNLWRFNLNNTDPQYWVKDYKLFKAMTTATPSKAQPITGAPTLGVNAKKGFKTMVYFGTGKYFDVGDGSAIIPAQSFYAILDKGSEVARSTLLQKTLTTTGKTSRTVSTANPNWDTQNGWYLDFNYSGALGERVTTKPLLLFDKLIFPTLIPTTAQCDAGGGSWLMEIVAIGDKYVNEHVLYPAIYDPALVVGNVNYVSLPDGGGVIVKNNSSGEIKGVKTTGKKPLEGRESWRQIQ